MPLPRLLLPAALGAVAAMAPALAAAQSWQGVTFNQVPGCSGLMMIETPDGTTLVRWPDGRPIPKAGRDVRGELQRRGASLLEVEEEGRVPVEVVAVGLTFDQTSVWLRHCLSHPWPRRRARP